MTAQGQPNYREFSEYSELYLALRQFTAEALTDFTTQASATAKNLILANFVAGAIQRLDSILCLWERGHIDDCWILHRAVVDRYVHLKSFVDNDDFAEFERWSLQIRHSDTERVLNNSKIMARVSTDLLKKAQEARRERQTELHATARSNWHRPKAEDVLTGDTLTIVYLTGYNFASTKVHPMVDDGERAFISLTTENIVRTGDDVAVLHNSFAIVLLILREWLYSSGLRWARFVGTFYNQIEEFLIDGSTDYRATYEAALSLSSDVSWCQLPSDEGD